MRKLTSLAVVLIALGLPAASSAQIAIEARGDLGVNQVEPATWLGLGTFDANRMIVGGDLAVVIGRREPQGLQVALEAGYQRLLAYKRIVDGQPVDQSQAGLRLFGATRFWINDAAFYGEFGAGVYFFEDGKNPLIGAAFGKMFDVGERISIPVRVRANVVFDPAALVVPFYVQAGVAYRLGA